MAINPVFEKLMLVVVGALAGVVPVIVSTRMQAISNTHQRALERKLDAIRSYSLACNRRVMLAQRAITLDEMRQRISTLSAEPQQDTEIARLVEFQQRQYESLSRDVEEARISLRSELAFANALFGVQLPVSIDAEPAPSPLRSDDLRKFAEATIAATRKAIPTISQQCVETTRLLISKLEE